MNKVVLIGRIARPLKTHWNGDMAIVHMTIAVDKETKRGEADFISVSVFGKQAETCERYLSKGRQVAVDGRIVTGSYEKDGRTVYTTEVIANRVEFIGSRNDGNGNAERSDESAYQDEQYKGFRAAEEDIPF